MAQSRNRGEADQNWKGRNSCFDRKRAHQKLGYHKQRGKQTAAEARPCAQQMDGKHRGTGSTSAATEEREGEKKEVTFAEEGEKETQ